MIWEIYYVIENYVVYIVRILHTLVDTSSQLYHTFNLYEKNDE